MDYSSDLDDEQRERLREDLFLRANSSIAAQYEYLAMQRWDLLKKQAVNMRSLASELESLERAESGESR